MSSVRAEWQGIDAKDGVERQIGVEMGKELAAARGFVDHRLAEGACIDRDQQQIPLAREMPGRGFACLVCGGEVDVTIRKIDRCPFYSEIGNLEYGSY